MYNVFQEIKFRKVKFKQTCIVYIYYTDISYSTKIKDENSLNVKYHHEKCDLYSNKIIIKSGFISN